jgi:L-malate glycosyltransferase
MRFSVLGSNSGRNAGDAAILASIINNFSKINGKLGFDVPTTNCRYIRDLYKDKNVKPVSIMPWTGSVRILGISTMLSIIRSDVVLITDGIIFDIKLFNPLFNFLILLAFLIPFARLMGKKVICFCVGVGPLDTKIGRKLARMVCNMSQSVMVREQSSYDLLEEVGVRPELMEIYPDAAFVNSPSDDSRVDEILAGAGVDGPKKIIGINVNSYIDLWLRKSESLDREYFVAEFARAADLVIEKLDVTILFTITQVMDIGIAEEIMERMQKRDKASIISNIKLTNHDIMGAMGRMELFVGMRLHSLILSSAMYAPVMGLAYAPKVRHFMKMIGMPELIYELEKISAESLSSAIINAYNNRESNREKLKPVIDEIKQKALAAFGVVNDRFLNSEDGKNDS